MVKLTQIKKRVKLVKNILCRIGILKSEKQMKKIGKEVAFLLTHDKNPRNGEGTFARFKDGSILHVFTEYCGEIYEDDGIAHLCAVRSTDEGETWSDRYLILEKDDGAKNYMSPSLLRLPNGHLGMFFLRKEKKDVDFKFSEEACTCMPAFCYSADEGKTWSDFVFCIDRDGYFCGINDGILLQRSGRILMPLSSETEKNIVIVASDDCGKSWYTLCEPIALPYPCFKIGLQEPGIYEHENGELWVYCRTLLGYQYQSRSSDNGKTWGPVIPNLYFSSPNSPMRVKKVGKYTVSVFNPVSCTCMKPSTSRRPFVCAVSTDDGMSFNDFIDLADDVQKMRDFASHTFCLEDSLKDTYCYPSIIETNDGFLVAYYHSNGGSYALRATKITKVYYSEIE